MSLAAALATIAIAAAVFCIIHHVALDPAHLGTVLLAGPMIMAVPKSIEDLIKQSTPSVPGQLEAVPWCFYDTQTYVDNTTTTLPFFANVNADKTLCNMEAAAAIPAPNYFEIVAFTIDFLSRPTNAAAAVTGALDDIAALQNTARGQFIFTMNQKPYVSVPMRSIGSSGGAVGLIQGTTAANAVEEWATNGMPGANPLHINKAVTIAPNNNFGGTLNWAAAADLTANLNICIGMWGVYHRKVV